MKYNLSHVLHCIILIVFIQCNCELINQYIEDTGSNGEDIWRSTSYFMPNQSQSYGTIRVGQIMSMEFDFVFNGRTNNPRVGYYENFFRVGYSAYISKSCEGEGSRYPSFWLTNNEDTMHVSVSSGTTCQPEQSLTEYGIITIGLLYHIKISFNNTYLLVEISGGNKPPWNKLWTRQPTQEIFLGQDVSVWFMSNKFTGTDYNVGNGTFSNITIISKLFTLNPTVQPTIEPTTNTPTISTINPTNNPTITPTYNPSITPSITPTNIPTIIPSNNPTITPTITPTYNPSNTPTGNPIYTQIPTQNPSNTNTGNPSNTPTQNPTITPTENPTETPTENPSITPTNNPITISPSITPTYKPSPNPTYGNIYECKHNEDCNVYCLHPNDCSFINILCPKTKHECNVYCTQYSCVQMTISAFFAEGGIINIECNGVNSCKGAMINAVKSMNTTLNVYINDTHALENGNIYCADNECNIMT